MTVTRDQAQMLTNLAIACRPHRAPTWDAAGVMAMLERVRHMDLAEVVVATIRLAKDPTAHTPADVAKPSAECWREQLKAPKWTPDQTPREQRCSVCNHGRHDGKCPKCAPIDDHAFEPDVRAAIETDVHATVTALRALKAESQPAVEPAPPAEPGEYHDNVQRLRAELAQVRGTETTSEGDA